jgi:hypothetical protein
MRALALVFAALLLAVACGRYAPPSRPRPDPPPRAQQELLPSVASGHDEQCSEKGEHTHP